MDSIIRRHQTLEAEYRRWQSYVSDNLEELLRRWQSYISDELEELLAGISQEINLCSHQSSQGTRIFDEDSQCLDEVSQYFTWIVEELQDLLSFHHDVDGLFKRKCLQEVSASASTPPDDDDDGSKNVGYGHLKDFVTPDAIPTPNFPSAGIDESVLGQLTVKSRSVTPHGDHATPFDANSDADASPSFLQSTPNIRMKLSKSQRKKARKAKAVEGQNHDRRSENRRKKNLGSSGRQRKGHQSNDPWVKFGWGCIVAFQWQGAE